MRAERVFYQGSIAGLFAPPRWRHQSRCAPIASAAKLTVEYLSSVQSGDLAFTTAIERADVKVAGQDKAAPMALRVTHVYRKEDGAWKLVLRHADPLVAKTAPESVLEKR
jgi:ketosteroid isomerase-like protein